MELIKNARTLEIIGMTGDACIKKVADAIKNIPGVITQAIRLGSVDITFDDSTKCQSTCFAINAAGFKASIASGTTGEGRATRLDARSPEGYIGGTGPLLG